MKKTIFKYPLQITDRTSVLMPQGAEVLCVQVQNGDPCIWALVDPEAETEHRNFEIYGTGHRAYDMDIRKYIGTFQLHDGALVFHVFEVIQ